MWFYPILLILVLLGLAGAIFLGGVFTLVLVPLVVIAIVSAFGYALAARRRAVQAGATASGGPEHPPLPHQHQRTPSQVRTTPERLVEGRRQQEQVRES